jgi:hypothetical protein
MPPKSGSLTVGQLLLSSALVLRHQKTEWYLVKWSQIAEVPAMDL